MGPELEDEHMCCGGRDGDGCQGSSVCCWQWVKESQLNLG